MPAVPDEMVELNIGLPPTARAALLIPGIVIGGGRCVSRISINRPRRADRIQKRAIDLGVFIPCRGIRFVDPVQQRYQIQRS